MSLHGVTLTAAGLERLAAGHPQLPLSDVVDADRATAAEPGRPLRFLTSRGEPRGAGVADPENDVWRVWGDGGCRALDATLFRDRVRAALALRQTLGLADGRSAYRLINGEGDGLGGLQADVYGSYAVVTAPSRGLLGHARLLAESARQVYGQAGLPLAGVVLKARLKAQGGTGPARSKDQVIGDEPPPKLVAYENDVGYELHLRGGLNVGLFTDMRDHRARLARFVRGRRVLNTFAYTGALSVAAARAGAAAVTSVDLASGPLAWAQENFRLSGLDPHSPRYRWEASDVLRYLDGQRQAGARYDVIILDPPTVSGARVSSWAQKRDYPDLIAAAVALLPPEEGGHLWVSSNTHRGPSVIEHIEAGLARSGRRAAVLDVGGLPPDYPTLLHWPLGRYLEVCQLRVLGVAA